MANGAFAPSSGRLVDVDEAQIQAAERDFWHERTLGKSSSGFDARGVGSRLKPGSVIREPSREGDHSRIVRRGGCLRRGLGRFPSGVTR